MKDELYHYGVKGMRWGHRKERMKKTWNALNEPSIPGDQKKRMKTPLEQMTRSGSDIAREGADMARTAARIEMRNKRSRHGSYDNVSDAELRRRINRLQMERQYEQLTMQDVGKGYETVADILGLVGNVTAIAASAATIYSIYKGLESK